MEISGKVVVIGETENVGQKGFTKRLRRVNGNIT